LQLQKLTVSCSKERLTANLVPCTTFTVGFSLLMMPRLGIFLATFCTSADFEAFAGNVTKRVSNQKNAALS